MKLVLTDATQIEIDSMSSEDLEIINSVGFKDVSSAINVYFKLGEDDDPIQRKKELKEQLTNVNIAGAYIIRDDGRRINISCKELYNLVLRISDTEYTLSGIFI